MSYPDLPHIPELDQHRGGPWTVGEILGQAGGALHAADRAVQELEDGAPALIQLSLIRFAVIECRRSTFVLQRLGSLVDGFGEWYEPRQDAMRADELLRYFVELRNQIEKRGLPGAMAELVDSAGRTIADVACGEGRHGIWVSGASRPGLDLEAGPLANPETLTLRNFRLPDPPRQHRGRPLDDFRFSSIARLAIDYLWTEVIEPARSCFSA